MSYLGSNLENCFSIQQEASFKKCFEKNNEKDKIFFGGGYRNS